MRILFATAALAVLAYGAGASAQVAGVITSQTVDLSQAQLGQPSNVYSTSPTITGGGGAAQYYTDQAGSALYNNYQVATVIQPGYIEFANNATSSGFYNSITATTSIAVTYTNPTNHTVTPTLNSTILPGGFGFYMGDLSAGYNGGIADINKVPESTTTTFFDTNGYSGSTPTDTEQIGLVSFEFDILSGGNTVASYTSSLALTLRDCCENAGPGLYTPYTSVTGDLTQNASAMTLNNFALIAADDPNKAIGWRWDATDISVPLGALAAGASSTLSYVTIVHTETYSPGQPYYGQNLIAYSGFGDPIGKTGGGNGIGDPNFPLLSLGLPTFDPVTGKVAAAAYNGMLSGQLPLVDIAPVVPAPTAVPEPTSWALMLAGFGLVGGVLRGRPGRRLA